MTTDRRLTFVASSVSHLRRSVWFHRDVLAVPLGEADHDAEKRAPGQDGTLPGPRRQHREHHRSARFVGQLVSRLRGRVVSGRGDFSYWMNELSAHYERKTGVSLYPGTLDLKLDEGGSCHAAESPPHWAACRET